MKQQEMTSEQFRAWRKGHGLKQKEAAALLGLKKRMIQYYEKGERDGKNVSIPRAVRLACYALSQGVVDFDGRQELRGDIRRHIDEARTEKPVAHQKK